VITIRHAILVAVLSFATIGLHAEVEPNAPLDELREHGDSLALLLTNRDGAGYAARFDADFTINRIIGDADFSATERRDFAGGLRKGLANVGPTLVASLQHQNAQVKRVASRRSPEGSTQILRVDYFDKDGNAGGHEYLELELNTKGQIRDWYSHAQGSRYTDTARLLTFSLIGQPSLLSSLFGTKDVDEAGIAAVRRYGDANRAGNHKGAYEAMGQWPAAFRETRQWAVLRASLSITFDEAAYRRDLTKLAEKFGTETEMQFMLIDYHFYRNDFASMIDVIQQFEKRVVADGATNQLECTGFILWEKYAEAERACRDGIRLESSFKANWWSLVEVFALTKRAQELTDTLTEIEQRFELVMNPDILIEQPNYEWLADDPVFKKWAKKRR